MISPISKLSNYPPQNGRQVLAVYATAPSIRQALSQCHGCLRPGQHAGPYMQRTRARRAFAAALEQSGLPSRRDTAQCQKKSLYTGDTSDMNLAPGLGQAGSPTSFMNGRKCRPIPLEAYLAAQVGSARLIGCAGFSLCRRRVVTA